MSRRKQAPLVISADVIWQMRKPKYDGYAIGTGPHKSKKHKRMSKAELLRQLRKDYS